MKGAPRRCQTQTRRQFAAPTIRRGRGLFARHQFGLKLRAEGKSFVMKDGVNPLTAKVAPVVAALNAPACQGIEEALKALDGVSPQAMEREPLQKVAAVWEQQIMQGDISTPAAARLLGRIAVARGVEGYNRFVTEYNDGKAALK